MELFIIRHGQSEADLLNVHEGRADFPLTSLGKEQAGKMATKVATTFQPEIILASPLKRAKETAAILQQAVGCPLTYYEELMELNNGVLAGLARQEAEQKYPLPKGGRPPHHAIEAGESMLQLKYRAEFMWQTILHEYKTYQRIAVVSHGGFISELIKVVLKQQGQPFIYPTGDTGIHHFSIRENDVVIRFINNTAHIQ